MLKTTKTSSYLNSLRDAGADAMSNLYYVEFIEDTTTKLGLEEANLTIRSKDFTLPTFAQETHTVNYMTTSVDLPKPSWSGEKVLKFTFRVDCNYQLYKALKAWRSLTSDPNRAYASNVIPGEAGSGQKNGVTINVYALNVPVTDKKYETPPEGNDAALPINSKELLYVFEDCWIKSISALSFSYESADPLTVSVEVSFAAFNREKGLAGSARVVK